MTKNLKNRAKRNQELSGQDLSLVKGGAKPPQQELDGVHAAEAIQAAQAMDGYIRG